ncbi:hypothetical protein LSH36_1376g00007 [Paralvinella palmiformis]|uniref:Uncharacterized protein n=1 Tax=Paralvinella palmiformis TaxID=53620 RepID=A0AAD9ITM1_9ANNE|nr:hypothetical protein LSH36_1376g00007 [Paralvinella palmiformis]
MFMFYNQSAALRDSGTTFDDPGEPIRCDPGYASIEGGTDPDTPLDASQWDRVSNVSFETFKGPKSGSDGYDSRLPDTTEPSSEGSAGQVLVEAIYSEVRKKKPDTADNRDRSAKTPPRKTDERRDDDIESLVMSFDDLLESFRLSLTDMAGNDVSADGRGTFCESTRTLEPDVLPELTARDQQWRRECPNQKQDADLMMSDEVVIRQQKKSVSFNDVIQERPVSLTDATPDQSEAICYDDAARHLVNGGHHTKPNGVLPRDKETPQNKMALESNVEKDMKVKMAGEKPNVIGYDKGHRTGNDVTVRATSGDNLKNHGNWRPPEVESLMKTQTVLLMFTWFCLGIMADLNTNTYPMMQPPFVSYTETIARSHVTRGTGSLLAAIFVGVSCSHCINNALDLVVLGLILMSITLAVTPWCINVIAALGSALVPQLTSQLGSYSCNWTLPTGCADPDDVIIAGDVDDIGPSSYGYRSDFAGTTSGNLTEGTFLLRMPSLLPLYGGAAILGLLCVIVLCAVIGKLSIRTRRQRARLRREMTSRKAKLKSEIRLVESADVGATTKGRPELNNNGAAQAHSGMETVLAIINEVRRQNGTVDPHVDEQLHKLLTYALTLQRQESTTAPPVRKRPFQAGENDTNSAHNNQSKWLQSPQTFSIGSQMYLYVFLAIGAGLTAVYDQFLALYARERMAPKFDHQDALVATLFWLSVAAARIAVVAVSKLLSVNALMVTCLVTNTACSAVMAAYADRYPVLLWLFTGLLGVSIGPVLPGAFTWADVYFNMRAPKVVALVCGFWSVGVALFPWLCGFVAVSWRFPVIYHVTLATGGLAFVLYIPMLIAMSKRRHGNGTNNMATIPIRTYL